MKPYIANLVNAAALIIMGVWGYFETGSATAFIPAGFGVALALCTPGVKSENKAVAHIAVLLTLLILLALAGMRLPKALNAGGMGLVRTLVMIATSVVAMIAFVKSFIDARKARNAAS
ncbi:MAG: hypothetical protein AAFV25_00550 [Bacteroidota bacterium]